jgi:hypothetical protein
MSKREWREWAGPEHLLSYIQGVLHLVENPFFATYQ